MKDTGLETRAQRAYRISACQGKERFDRATANRVARETKKIALVAYQCRCCAHWHVGHDLKRRKGRATK